MSRFDNNCLWITGHFDDRIPRTVPVRVFGRERKTDVLFVADPVHGDGAHRTDKLHLVELFCKHDD